MRGLTGVGVVLGARGAHGLRAERRIAAARGSHATGIVERRDVEGLGTPVAARAMAVAEVRDEPAVAQVETVVFHSDAVVCFPVDTHHGIRHGVSGPEPDHVGIEWRHPDGVAPDELAVHVELEVVVSENEPGDLHPVRVDDDGLEL